VSRSASAGQPEFFTDRSLGRYIVPNALRDMGLVVHTMAETYGERAGQGVEDEDWLALCGHRSWVALHKDHAIGRPTQGQPRRELRSLIEHRVRSFCIMSQSISAEEIIVRYRADLRRLLNIATARPGPYLYGLYGDGMREVWPAEWRRRGVL
jgi:hypothetical protein